MPERPHRRSGPRPVPVLRRVPARRAVTGAVLLGGLWLGLPGTALAHSTLRGSEPAGGAVLPTAPGSVRLVFTEPLSAKYGLVTVTGPDGEQAQSGSAEVRGVDVTQPLEPLTLAGRYRVSYRLAASGDAHPVVGTLHFDVTAGAAPPTVSLTATQDDSLMVRGVGLTLGGTGLLMAGIGWAARRKVRAA